MTLTAEQLDVRMQGIGASEIPAICGLLPDSYESTAITVWVRKTGGDWPVDSEQQARMDWGNIMERPIAEWYERAQNVVLRVTDTLVHVDEPWIRATPDFLVREHGECIRNVQVKNVGFRVEGNWDDGPPPYVIAQVTWEMLVLRSVYGEHITRTDVVAALGGAPPQVFHVDFDPELAARLVEAGREFWGYVERNEPPPVDSNAAWKVFLKERYPTHQREWLDPITPEVEEMARYYLRARAAGDKTTKKINRAKHYLQNAVGDGAGFMGGGIVVTWKANKRGVRTLRVKERI